MEKDKGELRIMSDDAGDIAPIEAGAMGGETTTIPTTGLRDALGRQSANQHQHHSLVDGAHMHVPLHASSNNNTATTAIADATDDLPAATKNVTDSLTSPRRSSADTDAGHGTLTSSLPSSPSPSQLERPSSTSAAITTADSAGTSPTTAATEVTQAQALPFVAPSSYLRPLRSLGDPSRRGSETGATGVMAQRTMHPVDREQIEGLRAIRAFLKVRTTYDVLPLSYRLIVLDTGLLVKKSLNILIQCGIVSAPLWDSKTSTFAGLLTTSDYLNVVQYYWQNPDALAQIDQFRLNSLREIERAIGVTPIETVSIHPLKTLYEACRRMLESRARRLPLIDVDDETQREMVVSVLTQYRILKFVSVNVKETQMLRMPLRDLKVGTYENVSIAYMDTPAIEVIHMLVQKSISSVPILDRDGTVLNVFEAVDVIALIKGGDYDNLQLSVGKALEKRSEDFPGIYTCTLNDRLDTIFDTIRKSRVHRLVVIDEHSQLKGLLSLSDILDYTLNSPLGDDDDA